MLKNKKLVMLFLLAGAFGFARADFIYDAKGKRNPFIPLVDYDGRLINLDKGEEKTHSDLIIDGIIYDKQGASYALVNDKVVMTGDYINEYRVIKIESNKVVFLKEGFLKEVTLHNGEEN